MRRRNDACMPVRHVLLAIGVAAMWGFNFIAINLSLDAFPPFLLAALRFSLIAIPTVLFVHRPRVQWRWLIGYGVGFGIIQFAFLYWGMAAGMPPGLASLVLQASAPFTVLLGAVFLRERMSRMRTVGIVIAVAGLFVVGWQRSEHAALLPFMLTLIGAFGWALGNICVRQAQAEEPFRLTLWMSVVPPIPFFALSLVFEGPDRIAGAVSGAFTADGLSATLGLLYTVIVATIAGSGIWTWLMARHPAGMVAPFSLLVPVFGMTAAWVCFGETTRPGELAGAVLIVAGVLIATTVTPRSRTAPTLTADVELNPTERALPDRGA